LTIFQQQVSTKSEGVASSPGVVISGPGLLYLNWFPYIHTYILGTEIFLHLSKNEPAKEVGALQVPDKSFVSTEYEISGRQLSKD
jgi:hypothetical protein